MLDKYAAQELAWSRALAHTRVHSARGLDRGSGLGPPGENDASLASRALRGGQTLAIRKESSRETEETETWIY